MKNYVTCTSCSEEIDLDVLNIHLKYECNNDLSVEKFKKKNKNVDNKNI